MANLAVKYRPKSFEDVVGQNIVVDMLKKMCEADPLECRNFLLVGPAGTGKAQPLYSKVLTPTGFINMKDVSIGTEVFTRTGDIATVSGVYPQGCRPIYEITTTGNNKIRVSDEHLNVVHRYNSKSSISEEFILTTNQLLPFYQDCMSSDSVLYIDSPTIDWKYQPTNYHPWLAGVMLSESIDYGTLTITNLSNSIKSRLVDILKNIDCELLSNNSIVWNGSTSSARYALAKLCQPSKYQFRRIAPEYLMNSKQVRLSLLSGLLSMDGYVQDYNLTYSTLSPLMSDDFKFLVQSLGIRDTISLKCVRNSEIGIRGGRSSIQYIHSLEVPNDLELSLSNNLKFAKLGKIINKITSIEYVGVEECQCIYVNHIDHTYVSDNFIPTHNTTSARIIADLLNNGQGEPIEIDAASNNGAEAVRNIVQQARSFPIGCKYKVFICDECFHADTLITLPEGTKRIADIVPGDAVYTLTGTSKVKSTFCNTVPVNNLVIVNTTKSQILTTSSHLFFTLKGWAEASKLSPQDQLLSSSTLLNIQNRCDWVPSITPICTHSEMIAHPIDDTCYLLKSVPNLSDSSVYNILESEVLSKGTNLPTQSYTSVTSVVPYQPGNNDELFTDYFSIEELNSGYVNMYDLEIDGHPSYLVNDVLVHNCHSFSAAAWSVWLKTLEESPAKSVFIMCTTNPEKIPPTILSRVQVFQLSKISLEGIHNRLLHVINEENKAGANIVYSEDAVNYIAKLAQGGMRDALTLLDKALAYSNNLSSENLSVSLNLPNYNDYFLLLGAYAKKNNEQIASIIDTVYNSGINFVKWFEGFHSFVINIVKYIFLHDINATMIPSYYEDKISCYSNKHSAVCLKLANKLVTLNHELKSTQYLQELALTYLCTSTN